MARDLKLEVVLQAIDRATRPIKSVMDGSIGLARTLKETRNTLKSLQTQQKDVGSFRTLKTASQQTTAAVGANRDRVRQLSRELANTANPTKQLSAEFKRAVREGHALKQKHTEQQRELQGLRSRLGAAGISTRSLGQHERELRQRIQQTNQSLSQQETRLRQVTAQQKRLAQAKASYQHSQQLAGSMAASGAGMMGAGVAKGYVAAQILAPGVAWAEQMATLQAVGRFDANDERYLALREQSRDLGASTAFSATEVGAGQEFLLRAGMSADAIKASMRDVLDLALANNTELGRAADIASNIAGAFKIDMEAEGAMGRVSDVLSGAASRANVNLEMLGETMKYLGGAEDLGLTLEQAASMAGLLGSIGVQGSQAGTTMRAMMNRLTNPVGKAREAMRDLNLEVSDAQGNMRPLPEILRDINQSTADLGNVERKALLQQIFGEEAGSGTSELVSKMSTGELDKLIGALGGNAGENARMAKVMADNVGGDLKSLRSAWEEVGISITDTNDGALRGLVQSITSLLRGVGEWIKENPRLAGALAKIVGVLIVLTTVGGALTLMIASMLGPIAMLRYGAVLLGVKAGGLSAVFGLLTKTAIPALLGGLKAITALLLANPIVLVVAAIAAAAYLIYRNWGAIGAWFSTKWAEVKAAFGQGIFGIAKLLLNWSPLGLLYRGITAGLSALGVDLPERFKTLGGAIVDGLLAGFFSGFAAIKNAVVSLGDSTVGWFKEKLGIQSPSRVFAALGGDTMAGLQQGLAGGSQGPLAAVTGLAKQLAAAGAVAIGTSGAAMAVDARPPIAAGAGPVIQGDTISITINAGPGARADDLAQEINRILDERERGKSLRMRAALYDRE